MGVRTGVDVLVRAAALAAEGTAFVLATVTWRRGPSSGKGGCKAVVHADGRVEGWLGGACSEPTVVRHALQALADGTPRLIVLGEDDARPDVVQVSMACASEGAMEVFVEPFVPAPDVWVVGRSPAVRTLADLAATLGWRAHVLDDGHPDRGPELSGVGPRSAVVVATQGHGDEQAVAAALRTPAAYVGLVASAKRAAAVCEWLRADGIAEQDLLRLRAPAGLDLGATEHHEIAVAVLAELVAVRATSWGLPPVPVVVPEHALDPVCGMTVDVATARWRSDVPVAGPGRRDGDIATVWFCAAGCKRAYDADPGQFTGSPP